MSKNLKYHSGFLNKYLAKYLVVGGFQFVFDIVLFLLMQQAGFSIFLSNTVSRLSAATLGYLFNRKFTFEVASLERTNTSNKFQGYSMALRYWVFWAVMTGISSLLIWQWSTLFKNSFHIGLGKLSIEAVLCIVGFFVSKRWVYQHAA